MPYDRMKLYVGVFVTFLIFGIAMLFYFIMDKKGYFDDYATFYFKTNNANTFFVGMPVNYSGFEIGTITQLQLTPKGEVKVDFKIKESDHKWICTDTYLILEKPLIGSATIAVKTSIGKPYLKSGKEIKMMTRDDINDIIVNIQPTLNELQQVIHSVNKITSKDGALQQSIENIERLTFKLAADQPLLTTVTGDPEATKSLNASLRKSTKVLDDIHTLTTEVDSLLKSLQTKVVTPTGESIKVTNEILIDIKKKLNVLDSVVATIGSSDKDLILLKKELHINLNKTHQMLDKVDALMTNKNDAQVVLP